MPHTITIGGVQYAIVDVTVSRMLTNRELAELQGFEVRRLEDLDPKTRARIERGVRRFRLSAEEDAS